MTELKIPHVMETSDGGDVVCDGHLDPQPFIRALLACGVFGGWISDSGSFDLWALLANVEHRWWLPDPANDEIGTFCEPDTEGAQAITIIPDYLQHAKPDDGAEMIRAERRRQMDVEGYTAEHDAEHDLGELTAAAICYLLQVLWQVSQGELEISTTQFWPWELESWKPSGDVERNLVRAGALICADIDRREAS